MPIRIQRKRIKGWRMPDNTVSVTRPGKWGNPFSVGQLIKIGNGKNGFSWLRCLDEKNNDGSFRKLETIEQVIDAYKELLEKYPRKDLNELTGKNLACFCKEGQLCHADILLELANK